LPLDLALSRPRPIVCNGKVRVPGLLSDPLGETNTPYAQSTTQGASWGPLLGSHMAPSGRGLLPVSPRPWSAGAPESRIGVTFVLASGAGVHSGVPWAQ
jgi:hypothetical protein